CEPAECHARWRLVAIQAVDANLATDTANALETCQAAKTALDALEIALDTLDAPIPLELALEAAIEADPAAHAADVARRQLRRDEDTGHDLEAGNAAAEALAAAKAADAAGYTRPALEVAADAANAGISANVAGVPGVAGVAGVPGVAADAGIA